LLPVCGVHVCRPHREAQRLSLGAFVISAFRFHSIWSIPFVLYQLVGYPIQRIFLYPPRLFPSHIAHRCPLQPLHRGILTHRCNEPPKHLCLGKQDISFGKPCPHVLRYRDITHRKDYPLSWAFLGSYRFGQDNIRIPSFIFRYDSLININNIIHYNENPTPSIRKCLILKNLSWILPLFGDNFNLTMRKMG